VPTSASIGVVDAGVVLTRLDRRRRSHAEATRLFERSSRAALDLHISVVNLAEALQHTSAYTRATGIDVVAVLGQFRVAIHRPDVEVARMVARLSSLEDASLADRFALGTARFLGARLHTTDRVLAAMARRCRIPWTLY
jgi:predicted nucleic acid-binding protein